MTGSDFLAALGAAHARGSSATKEALPLLAQYATDRLEYFAARALVDDTRSCSKGVADQYAAAAGNRLRSELFAQPPSLTVLDALVRLGELVRAHTVEMIQQAIEQVGAPDTDTQSVPDTLNPEFGPEEPHPLRDTQVLHKSPGTLPDHLQRQRLLVYYLALSDGDYRRLTGISILEYVQNDEAITERLAALLCPE